VVDPLIACIQSPEVYPVPEAENIETVLAIPAVIYSNPDAPPKADALLYCINELLYQFASTMILGVGMSFNGFLAVGAGAAIGAWMRWWLGLILNSTLPALPLGTLAANLVGGYLIGLFMGLFSLTSSFSPELRLFVITGLLGGLTTFSTFSAEAVTLLSRGQYGWATTHILVHVLGSLAMTGMGLLTVQLIRG
jgi:CrcB protein